MLPYKKHEVTVLELKIEKEGKETGSFQWLTNLTITGKTAYDFARAGRKRWKIENEGFNIQKHQRYEESLFIDADRRYFNADV